MKRQQIGAAMLLMVSVMLITVAASVFSTYLLRRLSGQANQTSNTGTHLAAVSKALVSFAQLNGRLPCPANAALATDLGQAATVTAQNRCQIPNGGSGVVPWATLGISQEMSFDGWGRKISYKVAQNHGATAGFVGLGQLNMTNCSLAQNNGGSTVATPCPTVNVGMGIAAGSGQALDSNLRPGLVVNDGITNFTQLAFVLISHGPTGYGAWTGAGGSRMTMPPGGSPESANAQNYPLVAVPPVFNNPEQSAMSIPPTSNTHFDDVVVSMTIADLLRAAGRFARQP